jgi:choline dehydrogenase-like flavoprotein
VANTLKPVDAVLVGFGWTGAIMGQQLCDAGLNVVALERGPWRDTATDFATGFAQDELRYMWRHHLFQNVSDDTITIRNNVNQEALPMRRLGSFLLGTALEHAELRMETHRSRDRRCCYVYSQQLGQSRAIRCCGPCWRPTQKTRLADCAPDR